MSREFLFMSGDTSVTLMATCAMDRWWHTAIADRLIFDGKYVSLSKRRREAVRGVVMYADVDDKSIELNNIDVVERSGLPCWPPTKTLRRMIDRFSVLAECKDARFIDHNITIVEFEGRPELNETVVDRLHENFTTWSRSYPVVAKVGNVHRGQGKFKIDDKTALETFVYCTLKERPVTVSFEPFFEGRSVRVLNIRGETFGLQVDNETTWVKNSAGAEISKCTIDQSLLVHAINVCSYFELEIAGIDYIVDDDKFHLLEVNHVPGVTGFDDIHDSAKRFFVEKMRDVEKLS